MNQHINSDRQRDLYRSEFEHDNCGVGMVANLSGEASHDIVVSGVTILKLLKEQTAHGKTVIIVTHNSLFADVADVVVRLKNGRIRSVSVVEDPKSIDDVEW